MNIKSIIFIYYYIKTPFNEFCWAQTFITFQKEQLVFLQDKTKKIIK